MYTVRPAGPDDFPAIAAFAQTPEELYYMYPRIPFPADPQALAELAAARQFPTLVEADGEPAGYANLYNQVPGESCWLGNVIIHPAHRGRGAAACLIETMMQISWHRLGVRELRLMCHSTNTRGLMFYRKWGFRPFDLSAMPNVEGRPGVLIHMTRAVGEGASAMKDGE